MKFDDLLELATEHWTHPRSGIHGVDHWIRVARNGETLAAATPSADIAVIHAFAALHDCQRVNDGPDPDHGRRAAALALDLELDLDIKQTALLIEAIANHADGETTTDSTIGCCWDADRLDLQRLGRQPSTALLSTPVAQGLAA